MNRQKLQPAIAVDRTVLRAWPLPPIDSEGDKETRGRVVVVAGSRSVPGAALLSGRAALRAGAGKVLIATARSVATAIAVALPEAKVIGLPETATGGLAPSGIGLLEDAVANADALLIGPGLEEEPSSIDVAVALASRGDHVPIILDAAALGAVKPMHRLPDRPLLLTPHAGEMAHLCALEKDAVIENAQHCATEAAKRWNAVIVLKGSLTTVVNPDGTAWLHEAAVPGLAAAGSGDVLAGLIAGLAARGAPLDQAAIWAVVVHAEAGKRLGRRIGTLGFLASELGDEVPRLLYDMSSPTR